MSSNLGKPGATLDQIEEAFNAHRPKGGAKASHFPKKLQQLAVSAISRQFTVAEIAKAAGVTPKSIRNWRNTLPKSSASSVPKVKRLKVVAQRTSPVRAELSSVISMARITLPSGVLIEVSTTVLSSGLLSQLCEVVR